ncbi:MAG: hypothetical protein RLY31_209 [Bacteroidota bacterium]
MQTPLARCLLSFLLTLVFVQPIRSQQPSIARHWNELLLYAIETDFARPPVHARNLFHISAAMYDAWAAYDTVARPYLLGNTVGGYACPFDGLPLPADVAAARRQAISYAAFRLLQHRFQFSPGAVGLFPLLTSDMEQLGYDPAFQGTDYSAGDPAALGNYIAQCYIQYGFQDGANELFNFANLYYQPVNPPLVIELSGNPYLQDFNRWQPITLDVFIDQSGNVIPFNTPPFQSPEWGNVQPFSLRPEQVTTYQRDGFDYQVYLDPGPPPLVDTADADDPGSAFYKWGFELVSVWSSHLAPSDTAIWDISPGNIGNQNGFPATAAEYQDFYNLTEGGDNSPGHPLNPKTGQPYTPQFVPRGDYTRVLAEFWADGPNSETPPGHWYTILNQVNDHPDFIRRFRGQGPVLDPLEWDVKCYFTLGGAMHDAAITVWSIKGWYDYIRPVSALRGMAELGQSSDPALPNFHPGGLSLIPGFVELVQAGDSLAGPAGEHIGKVKLLAWRGPDYILSPQTDEAGVGWILAENWWPYQRPSFVSPPFAGYVSGHSTFSRAAAEILTYLTGDPFFPGGMGEFHCEMDEFLVFEDGPGMDVTLQWATYRDASDQCSLSRIWGGIHPPQDDIPGRLLGIALADNAFPYAESFFYRDADQDGYYNYVDCDDNEPTIFPGAPELCDGLDNDCNGMVDDTDLFFLYFADNDADGFGDAGVTLDTCLQDAPPGFVGNNLDCDDSLPSVYPGAVELPDSLDNDCNGLVDDGITATNPYHPPVRWSVYPNPATAELFVHCSAPDLGTFQLFNNLGQLLAVRRATAAGAGTWRLALDGLPAGTYWLLASYEDGTSCFRTAFLRLPSS